MALLDLQGMELPAAERTGGGSRASLLLCGDSSLSVTDLQLTARSSARRPRVQPPGTSSISTERGKTMALLDLQAMELPATERTGGGSQASLLLCGDSSLSVTTCN